MTALRFFHRQFEGDYSVHGFRSTFQDWAAEQTDFPSEIVEHALAHLEGSATIRAYRRTDYLREAPGIDERLGKLRDGAVSYYGLYPLMYPQHRLRSRGYMTMPQRHPIGNRVRALSGPRLSMASGQQGDTVGGGSGETPSCGGFHRAACPRDGAKPIMEAGPP